MIFSNLCIWYMHADKFHTVKPLTFDLSENDLDVFREPVGGPFKNCSKTKLLRKKFFSAQASQFIVNGINF